MIVCRRSKIGAGLTAATLMLAGAPVFAQDVASEGGEISDEAASSDLDAIAARIPKRDYYPEGYRELLIASLAFHEAEAEDDRQRNVVSRSRDLCPTTRPVEFDVSDDPVFASHGAIAYDVGAIRRKLLDRGYEIEVVDRALEEFERELIALQRAVGAGWVEPETERELRRRIWGELGAQVIEASRARGLRSDVPSVQRCGDLPDRVRFNSRITRSSPRAYSVRGRGGPSSSIIVTEGGPATVYMTSRFNFDVCRARGEDPWDVEGCRWEEVETGRQQSLRGRFAYQVRWADGTERRGTRRIHGGENTFRKDGS